MAGESIASEPVVARALATFDATVNAQKQAHSDAESKAAWIDTVGSVEP